MLDPRIVLEEKPIASLDPMNAQVVKVRLKRFDVHGDRMVVPAPLENCGAPEQRSFGKP